jgi:integrase/recombinase XerC
MTSDSLNFSAKIGASNQSSSESSELCAWLAHLRVERRLSVITVERYRSNALRIRALLNRTDAEHFAWPEVLPQQLRDAIAKMHRQGLNGRSLAQVLASLRSLYAFLERTGELKRANPAKGIKAPKSAQKLPTVLDAEQAQQWVEVDESAELGVRDRAMMELFYSCGLRLSELCQLRWGAIDATEAELRVLGKGQKTRLLPIGRQALEALGNWREQCAESSDLAFVFPGREAHSGINPRTVQKRVKQLAQRQGLWLRTYPHLLRHAFASHLLESSGDLRAVQELLGHADIRTTSVYTHLNFQHLAAVYDQAHPRARKRPEPKADSESGLE